MKDKKIIGHLSGFLTAFIWASTFTSSKILLAAFSPFELLLLRFVIGFTALLIICPKRLVLTEKKQEFLFLMAGLCGVTIHYLTENMAVQYTMASTVGLIKSVSPLLIAIISCLVFHEGKLKVNFFAGFLIVAAGIMMVSSGEAGGGTVSIKGYFPAFFSAFMWAIYSLIIKKITAYGYNVILVTRRVFFYGILCMIPMSGVFGLNLPLERITQPVILINLLFLGIGASAVSFLSWNTAVKILGAVKTSVYIYTVPIITMVISAVVLHEVITWKAIFGMVLILLGLVISEMKTKKDTAVTHMPENCSES